VASNQTGVAFPESGLQHAQRMIGPALGLAPATFLDDLRADLARAGVQEAVQARDTAAIFDWLAALVQLQGVSDKAAYAYAAEHGNAQSADIHAALACRPACGKLQSYWQFDGCGYRKTVRTCSKPEMIEGCYVPRLPLRNGRLSQAAIHLHLFLRDVCDNDLVGWLDRRLAEADLGPAASDRAARMRKAVLAPLTHVHGLSNKVLSMALADLLLGGDPERERWVATGASMIAVDTLVHNFLERTGILRRLDATHPYGGRCYRPRGCAEIIDQLAHRLDAREFDSRFPEAFPRFVQFAIWHFCAADHLSICNGNRVPATGACDQIYCPASPFCDRALGLEARPGAPRAG
jgi:hypothetical protein